MNGTVRKIVIVLVVLALVTGVAAMAKGKPSKPPECPWCPPTIEMGDVVCTLDACGFDCVYTCPLPF